MNHITSAPTPTTDQETVIANHNFLRALTTGELPLGADTPHELLMQAMSIHCLHPSMAKGDATLSRVTSWNRCYRNATKHLETYRDRFTVQEWNSLGGTSGLASLILWHSARREFFR